jgi:hypothetical protein
MEADRCPRNQECEKHYQQVRIDPGQHFSRIRHPGEIRRDVNRVGRKHLHHISRRRQNEICNPDIPVVRYADCGYPACTTTTWWGISSEIARNSVES